MNEETLAKIMKSDFRNRKEIIRLKKLVESELGRPVEWSAYGEKDLFDLYSLKRRAIMSYGQNCRESKEFSIAVLNTAIELLEDNI